MAFFAFLSWFRPWWKTAETDYETVLARLTKDINSVQNRLIRVRQRERRVSVTLTFYVVVVWLAYAGFVWLATTGQRQGMTRSEKFRLWAPVGAGLLVIISTRFVVRFWYLRVAAGEEKHLRSLQSTRRKKVDEIKAATRYDHLRSLLEKYDDTGSPRRGRAVQPAQVRRDHQMGQRGGPGTPLQQLQPQPQQQQGQRQPASGFAAPKTPTESAVNRTPGGVHNGNTCAPGSTMQIRAPPGQAQPRTPAHAEKTYLDRIADKLLGVEGSTEGGGPEQRYALICQVCFNHNGLCPKEDWDEVQYICPRCGTFNSRRPSSRPTSLFWGSPAAVLPGDPASMQSRTSSTSSESSIGAPTHTRGRLSDVGVPGSSGLRPSPPSPLGPFSADRRRHTDVAEGDENAELQDDSGPRNGHAAQRRASSAGLASSSTALKERVQASQRRGYGGSDGTGYGLADEDVRHDGARDSARRDESHSSDMQVD